MKPIDLSQFYIPHERLIVREMIPGKRVDTFAPLPALAAHWQSLGVYPKGWTDSIQEIVSAPMEISNE